MCRKTVLKNALSSWGILSIQMQKAITADYSVSDFEKTDYPDGQEGDDLTSPTQKDVEGDAEPVEEPTRPEPKKSRQAPKRQVIPSPKKTPEEIEADAEMQGDDTLFIDDEQAELDRLWGAN